MDYESINYLIKLPYQKYLEYLCIVHNFKGSDIEDDLSLIGYSLGNMHYVDYYAKVYKGKPYLEIPYIKINKENVGKLVKYSKHGIEKKLAKLGFNDLALDMNYYVRYVLMHPKIRTMVNELGMKNIDLNIVANILKEWGNIVIPMEELKIYYDYFWDFNNMTIDDWYNYLETINDIEIRDRYVDILSNSASFVLGEYDYSDDIDMDSVRNYTFKKIYLRFQQLVDNSNDDELVLKYAATLRQYLTDQKDIYTDNSDVKALMALITDAEVGYKDIEDIFNIKKGKGTKEQEGKSGLDDTDIDLSHVDLPGEE